VWLNFLGGPRTFVIVTDRFLGIRHFILILEFILVHHGTNWELLNFGVLCLKRCDRSVYGLVSLATLTIIGRLFRRTRHRGILFPVSLTPVVQ